MKCYKDIASMKVDITTPRLVIEECEAFVLNCIELGIDCENTSFEYLLGGFVFLLETKEDLKEVATYLMDESEKRWLSLAETSAVFDGASFINNECDFAQVYMITTNSGGDIYYIPKELYTFRVLKSIAMTHNRDRAMYVRNNAMWRNKDNASNAS